MPRQEVPRNSELLIMVNPLGIDNAETSRSIGPSLLENVSWDDLRIFLLAARECSFRRAAGVVRTSSSTIVRRIQRLEEDLGVRLLDRLPDGVTLTTEGRSVFAAAQEMERASLSVSAQLNQELTRRGVVRCAVTEGLGTFWIMPHLAEFSQAHPRTIVDLKCSAKLADVLRMEADVAIQFTPPDRPDQVSIRLGRLHTYPFASPRYLETYGLPRCPSDLNNHRLIELIGPQLDDAVPQLLGRRHVEDIVALRTNAGVAHYYAVELGVGIGALATYARALGADVVPVDIGIKYHTDVWMTYHPDVRRDRRIAVFIDWLRSLFDTKRFPWFRDEFIHPNDLTKPNSPARVDIARPAVTRLPTLKLPTMTSGRPRHV
jgi:DNA-binding transcriptional LysR family regulator